MNLIFKFVLDYLWGKLIKEGIPALVDFISKNVKKIKINKEVDEETQELEELQLEAKKWLEKNPRQPLPPDLEKRLRNAARKRRDGLQ